MDVKGLRVGTGGALALLLLGAAFAGCKDDAGAGAVPSVSKVTIVPQAATVTKGETFDFSAEVTGENYPSQEVLWSIVESGKRLNTCIPARGRLRVSQKETLTTLTVQAVSKADRSKSATAIVTLVDADEPPDDPEPETSPDDPEPETPPDERLPLQFIMAGGKGHSLIVEEGLVWGAGDNTNWNLGLGETDNLSRNTFTALFTDNEAWGEVAEVAVGTIHSVLLTRDRNAWGAGSNYAGALGLGTTSDTKVKKFTRIGTELGEGAIKAIAAGFYSTYLVKNDGSLWVAGHNLQGKLGVGDKVNKGTFTQARDATGPIASGVTAIAAGEHHTIILKDDGTVWTAGNNEHGQLGTGDNTERLVFTKVEDVSGVKTIAAGQYFSLILKDDGSVWDTGHNEWGQLGVDNIIDSNVFIQARDATGPITSGVTAIAAGENHSLILKNGHIWVTGHNEEGQLGTSESGEGTDKQVFTQLTLEERVKAIGAGNAWSFIQKEADESIWATGYNDEGQLGAGDNENMATFTAISRGEQE